MSEALRQHLLMPVPPPRLLVKNPEPRVLVPNVHLANDRRVTPICIDPDVVVDDISKAEAVMKIQRRRAQQRIRSQRYREKKRMGGLKLDAVGFSLNAPSIPSPSAPNKESRPVLRAELQKGHLKQKPIGTIVPLQHKSVEGKTSPSRYTQRYYSSSGMSTFEPGLPKKTKSMMRANGLVVSYEWRTDSSGRKYLAGSRLIQVNPKPALHNKAIRASQGISYFSMKVEPSDDLAGVRTSDTDWQCLPLHNDWSQDVEIVPVKTENPEETDEQPSTRLQRPALAGDRKQSLRKEVQTLTYCRYCLYRRLVLRTKSLHTVYLAATKKKKKFSDWTPCPDKIPSTLVE